MMNPEPHPAESPSGTSAAATSQAEAENSERVAIAVREAIRGVLGWRLRAEDANGFVAKLRNAFQTGGIEGRTEWEWTPGRIPTDLGEITGAQASLYTRAKLVVDEMYQLLAVLRSDAAGGDGDDLEVVRGLVRSNLKSIVEELGMLGGPRVERVDAYFLELVGPHPVVEIPPIVGGRLEQLGRCAGVVASPNPSPGNLDQHAAWEVVAICGILLFENWMKVKVAIQRDEGR
jgi:hypothetical protein